MAYLQTWDMNIGLFVGSLLRESSHLETGLHVHDPGI
jgi:hypothetical protein